MQDQKNAYRRAQCLFNVELSILEIQQAMYIALHNTIEEVIVGMTMYKNFVYDYPERCIDVLNKYYDHAMTGDREVTLLLMATAGGFLMPYERLSEGKSIKQPTMDRPEYRLQMNTLEDEFRKKIKNSSVFRNILCKWRFNKPGRKHNIDSIKRAAVNANLIPIEEKVSTPIQIIRHSIAHGNVDAIESPSGQIQNLVFVSRDKNRKVVSTVLVVLTPEDLKSFIIQWCEFIKGLRQQDVLAALDQAAM